jgi:bifunctional non-homologous end joining protein LigD
MPKRSTFQPMLCESTEQPPEGDEWRYELKLDGYRTIAAKSGNRTQLWSRNRKLYPPFSQCGEGHW